MMQRRTFLVALGAAVLGRFAIPDIPAVLLETTPSEGPCDEPRDEKEWVRRLVIPPTRMETFLVWSEVSEDGEDVRSMVWYPETDEEWAEADRFYKAATYRRWRTLGDLEAILEAPGPWLLRLNLCGTLKFLGVDRDEQIFGDPELVNIEDDPALAATFSSERALDLIPRLGTLWLQDDEDYYFEPVRPHEALRDFRLDGLA